MIDPLYCAFAPLHRLPELFRTEKQIQRLNRCRDNDLEEAAKEEFIKILSPDFHATSYYLPVGPEGAFAERDLVLKASDQLFIVESKARPLRSVSGRRDSVQTIQTDVKRTIQEGYEQAVSAARYLSSQPLATLYDSQGPNRSILTTFDAMTVRKTHIIVVLDSYYGVIATNLKPWLRIDDEFGYPWVVDRHTLQTISLRIDSAKLMSEYLQWRVQLYGCVFSEDEACFAGFFVRHGPVLPPIDERSIVTLDPNYSDIFDATHFQKKGFDVDVPSGCEKPQWVISELHHDEVWLSKKGGMTERFDLKTGEWQKGNTKKQRARVLKGLTGRNDACPCESGKKYKKCCGR